MGPGPVWIMEVGLQIIGKKDVEKEAKKTQKQKRFKKRRKMRKKEAKTKKEACTKVGFACIAAANAVFWPAQIKVFKIT